MALACMAGAPVVGAVALCIGCVGGSVGMQPVVMSMAAVPATRRRSRCGVCMGVIAVLLVDSSGAGSHERTGLWLVDLELEAPVVRGTRRVVAADHQRALLGQLTEAGDAQRGRDRYQRAVRATDRDHGVDLQ